jgi:acyl-coenzyme A thioesterase PaaI-like protein
MRKILNPFVGSEGYHCFGCSPDNHDGLQMQFYEEGDYVISEWNPEHKFQGYRNVLHGGIQTTLMDELAAWVCYVKIGQSGMTYKIEAKFKKAVYSNQGSISIKGRLIEVRKNIASVETKLYSSSGELCSEAIVDYFIVSPEKAAKDLFFPGKDKFFEQV